jgi:hypothetical protein
MLPSRSSGQLLHDQLRRCEPRLLRIGHTALCFLRMLLADLSQHAAWRYRVDTRLLRVQDEQSFGLNTSSTTHGNGPIEGGYLNFLIGTYRAAASIAASKG